MTQEAFAAWNQGDEQEVTEVTEIFLAWACIDPATCINTSQLPPAVVPTGHYFVGAGAFTPSYWE